MWRDADVPPQYRVWRREDGTPWQLGSARAYKANDLRTNDLVTLRFFDAPVEHFRDKATLARLAETLSNPGSPHLNPLRDLFIRDGTHLAVTEFVEGRSLAERVGERGAWKSGAVLALARDTLKALDALHRVGVAHGSVGPAKLWFEATGGKLRIIDGGLHPGATMRGPTAENVGIRDDLRRLAMTLWFALTGQPPFTEGFAATLRAAPDRKPLDALPASESLQALSALFTRTLDPEEAGERSLDTAGLLAVLETPALQTSRQERAAQGPARAPHDSGIDSPSASAPELRPALTRVVRATKPATEIGAGPVSPRRTAGVVALVALGIGLAAARSLQGPIQVGAVLPATNVQPQTAAATTASVPEDRAETLPLSTPSAPPLTGGPPVGAVGVQARALRIRDVQPETLEVLKNARELRRAATLPVANGRGFPTHTEVEQVKAALAADVPETLQGRPAALVLILGYSDQPTAQGGAAESQEEADALAAALFHDGITAPVYACGLGGAEEMPEVDTPTAGDGGFVEVWVAFLLF